MAVHHILLEDTCNKESTKCLNTIQDSASKGKNILDLILTICTKLIFCLGIQGFFRAKPMCLLGFLLQNYRYLFKLVHKSCV